MSLPFNKYRNYSEEDCKDELVNIRHHHFFINYKKCLRNIMYTRSSCFHFFDPQLSNSSDSEEWIEYKKCLKENFY